MCFSRSAHRKIQQAGKHHQESGKFELFVKIIEIIALFDSITNFESKASQDFLAHLPLLHD